MYHKKHKVKMKNVGKVWPCLVSFVTEVNHFFIIVWAVVPLERARGAQFGNRWYNAISLYALKF